MDERTIDLGKRAVSDGWWRWMPGMRTSWGWYVSTNDLESSNWPSTATGLLPDLADPATLGCLLALVREKHGPLCHVATTQDGDVWLVTLPVDWVESRIVKADTEAEALVAALETPTNTEDLKDDD